MPNVRRRVRRIVQRRVRARVRRLSGLSSARRALVALTLVTVSAFSFVRVEPPASSACPVIEVKPLRLLYQQSALVAVARVGDSVATEIGEDSTVMKTALRISSLLKGETKERVVHLYHNVWPEMGEDSPYSYAKNDTLLVFLQPNGDGGGYTPVDYERGVKKLSPDDLKVYVRRLEELAPLLRSEKPDAAALTEWLVRCAEEPATRWEGAYELASDASLFEDQKLSGAMPNPITADVGRILPVIKTDEEQAKLAGDAAVNEAATAAATTAATEAVRQSGAGESGDRPPAQDEVIIVDAPEERIDFAAHLTPAHRERLTTALLAAEKLDQGEQMLLRLVGNWKDARLLPFSLKHLARMADAPPYHAEDLMLVVAHTLGDATLIKFVADYTEVSSYADNSDGDGYYEEEGDPEETPEDRAARKKEIEEMKAAAAEARVARSGKLRHFLALADQPQKP